MPLNAELHFDPMSFDVEETHKDAMSLPSCNMKELQCEMKAKKSCSDAKECSKTVLKQKLQ